MKSPGNFPKYPTATYRWFVHRPELKKEQNFFPLRWGFWALDGVPMFFLLPASALAMCSSLRSQHAVHVQCLFGASHLGKKGNEAVQKCK